MSPNVPPDTYLQIINATALRIESNHIISLSICIVTVTIIYDGEWAHADAVCCTAAAAAAAVVEVRKWLEIVFNSREEGKREREFLCDNKKDQQ